jgi:hypothetical protein
MTMSQVKEKDFNPLKIEIDLKIQQSVSYVLHAQLAVLYFGLLIPMLVQQQ